MLSHEKREDVYFFIILQEIYSTLASNGCYLISSGNRPTLRHESEHLQFFLVYHIVIKDNQAELIDFRVETLWVRAEDRVLLRLLVLVIHLQ